MSVGGRKISRMGSVQEAVPVLTLMDDDASAMTWDSFGGDESGPLQRLARLKKIMDKDSF